MFKQAVRENLGLVSLFLDNQSNCMLRICKTVSDDTGRIPLCVVVICLCVHGKLQSQLILEHCCENSRYMYVGPTDVSEVGSLHAAKGDSSRCDYDHVL